MPTTAPLPQALSNVASLTPYLPGKPTTALAREFGLEPSAIVKLASNENPWGMSPLARQALLAALDDGHRYPDQHDLIAALAHFTGLDATSIVLGNGSNDVLDLAARAFLAPGCLAVMAEYAFAVYPIATQSAGARAVVVPAVKYGHDLDAMLVACQNPAVRLVWVANPNNPTGTWLPPADLLAFIERLPKRVVVVVDEAYQEYLVDGDGNQSFAWVREHPNLIVTRTFSKIYGLAGLRVGYAATSPQIADWMQRLRQPFNVALPSLAAALAAMSDSDFVAHSKASNHREKVRLLPLLTALGCEVIDGPANFLAFAHPDAPQLHSRLLAAGVILRPLAGYGLPHHLRMTIGTPSDNDRCLAALRQALDR